MKAVVLAGGLGTRLSPLTRYINKQLLPVGRYPMIHYSIEKLSEAGINKILIITSESSILDLSKYLGDGQEWGVKIFYRIQESPLGIPNAVSLAEGFVSQREKFIVLLGDNLFEDNLISDIKNFKNSNSSVYLFLAKVEDSKSFGVPIFEKNKISRIIEKPDSNISGYCVTGIYMYDGSIFSMIKHLILSNRSEYEITDINNQYLSQNKAMYRILNGWWTDAGTFDALHDVTKKLLKGDIKE